MLHYFAGEKKQLAVGFYDFAWHGHRQLSKWAKTHKNAGPFLSGQKRLAALILWPPCFLAICN